MRIFMRGKAVWFAKLATLAAVPLVILWAMPTPPVGRSGAPGDTTCAACHGGAGGTGSVVVTSTSGMTSYTPGASKHFTVAVSGSGGNAGFEATARPASNLSGGVAGNLVGGTGTQVLCTVGTACGTGNPQYIRSTAATATPATWSFDWTAPTGSENVTLYVASAVGYSGNTYTASYVLTPAGPPPPTLSVTPSSLTFSYQVGGTPPAGQTLSISGVATTYTAAASGATWLSVSPPSGGTSGTETVAVNTAGLAAGTYSGTVTITANGSAGSPKTVPVTLNVTPAPPTLTVSPTSLTFAYQIGGTVPAAQTLSVSGVASTYTAAASGGTWLSVSPTSGGTSGTETVSVNTAGLAAGTYNGTVTITANGSTGSPKTVPVTLNVTPAPPTLTVTPGSLTFAYQIGSTPPMAQTLSVSGVASTYTAAASGGAWLSVSPTSGGTSGTETVSVNTAGLAAGTYSGTVTITANGSTGSPVTVPVTLNVTVAPPTLTVSPSSLTFAYQIGGTPPMAQTLTISGAATTYTAGASGGTWLSVSPASGGTSGTANVSVNTAGLAAGTYSGAVTISANGSTGSPVTVPVTLNVTPAPPTLTVTPSSLTFAYQIGGTLPASQTLSIAGVATTYTAVASGGTWLSVSPASGGTSGTANVSVNTAGLAAGTYSGAVTITAAGSIGSPATVPVTVNVTPPPPTLTVTPTSLTFSYQTGGAAPAAQSLAISGGSFNYTAVVSGGTWLSVSPAGGTAPGSVSVTVDTTGLAAGAYSGSVTITAPGTVNGSQVVPVNLTVTSPAPSLQVTPTTLSFSYATGTPVPLPYVLSVASSGTAVSYTAAASGGSWLSVAPAGGATPGAVFVSVNPADLAIGTYNALITVTSSSSPSSTQTVPIALAVTNAGPSACLVTHTDE
jgi:hypothetical protein